MSNALAIVGTSVAGCGIGAAVGGYLGWVTEEPQDMAGVGMLGGLVAGAMFGGLGGVILGAVLFAS